MSGPIHEREREIAHLAGALDDAVAGGGRVVVIEGAAGIGKTSLLGPAREAALARGFAVASARGTELERAYAWGVVRQLLEPRLRAMSVAARGRALSGAAALAAPIFGEAATQDASFGTLHGLYWLVAGLADERPQLLVVDDLQWADDASGRFLEFLVNRIDALPALLLVAQRPAEVRALHGAPRTTTLSLAGLSAAATEALLADQRGAPVSESFAAACRDATGGNPLLLQRLAVGLDGSDDVGAVARLGPVAVADTVAVALARLGDEPARLAQAVAVLDRAPLQLAARLAGIDEPAAAAAGTQLARAGILRDARPLEFVHALVGDAVVAALGEIERARLHAAAAALLADAGAAPEALAVHLLHAEPRGDETVAATLAAAGRRALGSGAPEEAATCLGRAAVEPPGAPALSAVLLDLARAEHALGRAEALEHVVAAYEAATTDAERADAALALSWASSPGRQDPGEALAMIERAIDGAPDSERTLKLEAVRLAAAIFMAGDPAAFGDPERFADLPGRTAGECELLALVSVHRFLGGWSAADVAEVIERAVGDPGLIASIGPESIWLFLVIGGLFKADRLAVASRTADVALAEAGRRGSAPGFAMASAWRAWIALREGSARDAEAEARAAVDSIGEPTMARVVALASLVEVLVERGALDEAQALLDDFPAAGPDPSGGLFESTRLLVREARGDTDGALRATPDFDPDFDGWLRIARLHHMRGDTVAAEREATAALRWAHVWGTPAYVGQALTVAGLVGGDLAQLREAVEQLEQSPARRELARSLVEFGAALRRDGQRVAAREPLRRALDLATEGGLDAIADRAREELRVTGAKVRRGAASGLASLTPSEQRIVELAAAGATNREIAQTLFVTVKTVEMHLGNAYRKLDVSSRRELKTLGSSTGSPP